MLFYCEQLPIVFPMMGEWRVVLQRSMTVLSGYSLAACQVIIAVCTFLEIFLETALDLTNIFALYLSVMLKMNVLIWLMLAGILLDQCGCSSCSTWPSSQTSRNNSCSPLCGQRRAAQRLKSVKAVLCVLPTICQLSLSACVTILPLVHVALSILSALFSNFRPIISSITASWGSNRPLLSTCGPFQQHLHLFYA